MRKFGFVRAIVAAIFAVALLAVPARAAVVIYDLTLTPITGAEAGNGVLWLDGPINLAIQNFGPGPDSRVDLFTITLGGHTFDLTGTFQNIQFIGGALWNAQADSEFKPLSLASVGTTYTFFDASTQSQTIGKITAELSIAAAIPEPATWALMIVGFAGLGFLAWRRTLKPASQTS